MSEGKKKLWIIDEYLKNFETYELGSSNFQLPFSSCILGSLYLQHGNLKTITHIYRKLEDTDKVLHFLLVLKQFEAENRKNLRTVPLHGGEACEFRRKLGTARRQELKGDTMGNPIVEFRDLNSSMGLRFLR